MKIQMVLGEVGENSDIPFESAGPLLRKSMRGSFHGGSFATGVDHLRKQILQIERFRSGARGGQNALTNFVPDCSNQSAAQSGLFTDMLDKKRRCCLPVSPGNGSEF